MNLIKARLKTQVLHGVEIMRVPVGKEYLIDLDSKTKLRWVNVTEGVDQMIDGVKTDDGGWLPFDVLEVLS